MKKISLISLVLSICCLLCSCGDSAFPSERTCKKWSEVEILTDPSGSEHSLNEYYPKDLIKFSFGECSFLLEADDGKQIYFGKVSESDEATDDHPNGYSLRSKDEIDIYDFGGNYYYPSSGNFDIDIIKDDKENTDSDNGAWWFGFAMRSQERVLITFYDEMSSEFSYTNSYKTHTGILQNTEPRKQFSVDDISIKQIEITKDKVTLRGATLTADGDYSEQISADGIEVVTELYKK